MAAQLVGRLDSDALATGPPARPGSSPRTGHPAGRAGAPRQAGRARRAGWRRWPGRGRHAGGSAAPPVCSVSIPPPRTPPAGSLGAERPAAGRRGRTHVSGEEPGVNGRMAPLVVGAHRRADDAVDLAQGVGGSIRNARHLASASAVSSPRSRVRGDCRSRAARCRAASASAIVASRNPSRVRISARCRSQRAVGGRGQQRRLRCRAPARRRVRQLRHGVLVHLGGGPRPCDRARANEATTGEGRRVRGRLAGEGGHERDPGEVRGARRKGEGR